MNVTPRTVSILTVVAVVVALPAARLLRRVVAAEAANVAVTIFVAVLLSSLAEPLPASAKEGSALARVGPGRVASVVRQAGYTLKVLVAPNVAAAPNWFELELSKNGVPVGHAKVTLSFAMLEMAMGNQEYQLTEVKPGVYALANNSALVMAGHWALKFTITPRGGSQVTARVVDYATG